MCPPAGLLRVIGWEASAASPSGSSSSEEQLERSGSSFSAVLSAPEEGGGGAAGYGTPPATSTRRRGGRTCSHQHGAERRRALAGRQVQRRVAPEGAGVHLRLQLQRQRPAQAPLRRGRRGVSGTSVISVQATLNRFSLTARWRALFPLFCSGALILAPPSTSRRRQRSPSLRTARWRG